MEIPARKVGKRKADDAWPSLFAPTSLLQTNIDFLPPLAVGGSSWLKKRPPILPFHFSLFCHPRYSAFENSAMSSLLKLQDQNQPLWLAAPPTAFLTWVLYDNYNRTQLHRKQLVEMRQQGALATPALLITNPCLSLGPSLHVLGTVSLYLSQLA